MERFAIPKRNILLIVIGLLVMILGFILLMGGGAENPEVYNYELFNARRLYVAPLFIIAGIAIEVVAIMWIKRKK